MKNNSSHRIMPGLEYYLQGIPAKTEPDEVAVAALNEGTRLHERLEEQYAKGQLPASAPMLPDGSIIGFVDLPETEVGR